MAGGMTDRTNKRARQETGNSLHVSTFLGVLLIPLTIGHPIIQLKKAQIMHTKCRKSAGTWSNPTFFLLLRLENKYL